MANSRLQERPKRAPALPADLPILYEDEEKIDMGEANLHTCTIEILHVCINAHLQRVHAEMQVFANMNLYYREGPLHKRTRSRPYVSPDIMIVQPPKRLPDSLVSYTIDREGPAPRHITEVLSEWTAEDGDLDKKVTLYAKLGVEEYILVDPTGAFLPDRLLLKRLQRDGSWKDERDRDGGVTSRLGFRIIIDADEKVRVVDAKTGQSYPRPDEALARVRTLEAELQKLRRKSRRQ